VRCGPRELQALDIIPVYVRVRPDTVFATRRGVSEGSSVFVSQKPIDKYHGADAGYRERGLLITIPSDGIGELVDVFPGALWREELRSILVPFGDPSLTAALLLSEHHQRRLVLVILHLDLENLDTPSWCVKCFNVTDLEQARAIYMLEVSKPKLKRFCAVSKRLALEHEYGRLDVLMRDEVIFQQRYIMISLHVPGGGEKETFGSMYELE